MQTHPIEDIESTLQYWEDMYLLVDGYGELAKLTHRPHPFDYGNLVKWQTFRHDLLQNAFKENLNVDLFIPPADSKIFEIEASLATLPIALFGWTRFSRRVFHLSQSLQLALESTSLSDIHWKDIKWPFDSFAITLDLPLQVRDAQSRCIIFTKYVSNINERVLYEFKTIPDDIKKAILTPKQRNNLKRVLKKKNPNRIQSVLTTLENRHFNAPSNAGSTTLDYEDIKDASIKTTFLKLLDMHNSSDARFSKKVRNEKDEQEFSDYLDSVLKICLGLCLYFQTSKAYVRYRNPEWQKEKSRNSLPGKNYITSASQVCNVSNVYEFNQEELCLLQSLRKKRKFHEVSFHFRRGTWRRAPGSGSDPNAPKTVWQRPTLVRPDRREDGKLPGGAKVIM